MVEKKPFLAVVVIQSIYAVYFLLTKLAFDVGMNTFVFVFYRQASATLFLAPIAIFFERMEKVNIRTSPGMIKIGGVSLCIGGVATIAFYRGPFLQILVHHHLINNHLQQFQGQVPSTKTWIKGVFLLLLSNLSWALWLVLQGRVLKSYPSKLVLTTLQCFLSTIQSFIVAVAFERDIAQWKLGWNLRLLSGIVVTGFTFYLQAWVIEKKGPVFLAMTTPLILVFTIIISAFFLGEIISLGSILGALLLVGGLYFVLWGKSKEEERAKRACQISGDVEKVNGGSNGEIAS
ncbi:hypothetical protein DH2020_047850 [Rehmannia glutinosa]|uniref:WAT1-related protein n=1 Tax=Rehmannia glutinosa TaxID=99300 RepID=A0ABR0U7D8_REHGL